LRLLAVVLSVGQDAGMFLKTTRVQRGNRTYEYLSLVESFRGDDGKKRHNTLFRLGEASALRETGELDRIIAALQAHAEGRYVDVDELEFDQAPMVGTMAAVRHLWDDLGLQQLFETIAVEAGMSWSLADAVFAMLAGRLVDPASKRRTHRWIVDDVIAPDSFSFPTLEQYYRALDMVAEHKDVVERHVYARVCDLTNLQLTLACYDLTSSYLEGDPSSHSRFPSKAFGYSRDRRSDRPQVVIGLLTSADGIPIAHHVFAGGTQDATTLKGVLKDLTDRFAVGRICVVADRGLITDDNIAEVEAAKCDWLFATKLRRRKDVAAVLAEAADADDDAWVEVERFGSRVFETTYDGGRYVVVFSGARQRRDTARRLQLIAKIERQLLALENRVRRGDLTEATKIAAAAATILARSPVKRLFDVSDVAEGRFVYDYDHAQLAYDEQLAGHFVLATSMTVKTADAAEVLACYRSLQHVEHRFRVLKSTLGLRPIRHWTENRVRGHIAVCVLAAVVESLIGNRLRDADLHDPDLDEQHLTCDRALQELDRIRQVTFTAGEQTITAITRRTQLQQQILAALGVDTRTWTRPIIHG
jgi:transposase